MPEYNRITLDKPKGPGKRTGRHRIVHSVDPNRADGYAFNGQFIDHDKQVDLPVGAVLVRQTPTGSNRYPSTSWAHAIIPGQGQPFHWSDEFDHTIFLTFRDIVHQLAQEQAPPRAQTRPTPSAPAGTPGPASTPGPTNSTPAAPTGLQPARLTIHIRDKSVVQGQWTAYCKLTVDQDQSVSYHAFRTSNLRQEFFCEDCTAKTPNPANTGRP